MTSISELLDPGRVVFLDCAELDPIHELCKLSTRSGQIAGALERAVRAREEMASTALDCGVAVPHGHIPELDHFVMALGICAGGVEWLGHPKDKPVRIVILIGAPEGRQAGYLKLLSTIVKLLNRAEVRENLCGCGEPAEVVQEIRRQVAGL